MTWRPNRPQWVVIWATAIVSFAIGNFDLYWYGKPSPRPPSSKTVTLKLDELDAPKTVTLDPASLDAPRAKTVILNPDKLEGSPQIQAEEQPSPLAQQFGVARLPLISMTRQPLSKVIAGYDPVAATVDLVQRAPLDEPMAYVTRLGVRYLKKARYREAFPVLALGMLSVWLLAGHRPKSAPSPTCRPR